MIIERASSHFVFIVPAAHVRERYNYIRYKDKPLTNKEYLDSWGKWLVFGHREELDSLAAKLDPFVEAQQVPGAKLDRKRIDEFGLDRCVMCVYCHFEDRNAVWNILESLGVVDKAWMFERETLENWLPGGVNLERWIVGRGLDERAAQAVRDDAEAYFRRSFGDPDRIFCGVEQ
jgi:hypothetical protein